MLLLSGLAKLFPITPTVKETGKSQKEADEGMGNMREQGFSGLRIG